MMKHVGLHYEMGSRTSTDDNPYGLTRNTFKFVTDDVTRLHELAPNIDTVIRHRPFGESPNGGWMDLDQTVVIEHDADYRYLFDDFEKHTARLVEAIPNIRIIDYYGTIDEQLEDRRVAGNYSALLDRLTSSVRPSLNAPNCSIALDATSGMFPRWHPLAGKPAYPDGSIYHRWAETMQACLAEKNARLYVEALPGPNNTWCWNQHAICLDFYWQEGFVEGNRKPEQYRLKSDEYETIRVASGHSRPYWQSSELFLYSCDEWGHTPVIVASGVLGDPVEFANIWSKI